MTDRITPDQVVSWKLAKRLSKYLMKDPVTGSCFVVDELDGTGQRLTQYIYDFFMEHRNDTDSPWEGKA